ncbi:MAG: hypothetical protein HKO13_01140 [Sphingomonas sp.]|nr:hypothetical protein [Sphingomonas sp.]
MSSSKNECDSEKVEDVPPTALGWVARIVSIALLLILVGSIVLQIVQPERDIEFDVSVVAEDIREQNGRYLIPVDITNKSTKAAREVTLELDTGTETTEVDLTMIGQQETITFVISAPQPVTSVDHAIVSYEAP